MDSILITGGSGYLGMGLVPELLRVGYGRICIYSRGEHCQAELRARWGDLKALRWFIGDVRDRDRLEVAMEGVGDVIHAAALKRIEVGAYNPEEMVKTNVVGSGNVVAACREVGVKRCLLISSDKAVSPVSPYGYTKALAEAFFLAANKRGGTRFGVCRYGNVAGSTGSVIPIWRNAIAHGGPVRVTDMEATRFWMTRDEAVKLVLDTLVGMKGGEVAVPDLPAFRLEDLFYAMGRPNLQFKVVGLPAHEKLHETMDGVTDSSQVRRMSEDELREALRRV